MKSILLSLIIAIPFFGLSQDIDKEAFHADIVTLYQTGMKTFKPLIDGEGKIGSNGNTTYASSLKLNGAESVEIDVDAEGSHTYIARYTFKNVRDSKAKLEEVSNMILEATQEFGLTKETITDIGYVGYQKHVIEFPADNIDDMGKHTSFSVGLTKDGNPMSLEIVASEILWK